jgi:uncharacterized protein YhaN
MATWKTMVATLGLPDSIDPQRLLGVTERYGQLAELEARARHRRDDAAARQREHDTLLRRIRDLAEEVGCVLKPKEAKDAKVSRDAVAERAGAETARLATVEADPLDQLDYMLTERRRQAGDVERRNQLAEKAKELKTEEGKHLHSIAGLKRRRAAMFQACGCEDEQQYRMMAADQHQAALLSNQRDAVTREIVAAIGRHEPEETFTQLLSPDSIGTLDQLWERATTDLDSRQARLKELAQQQGELNREQTVLSKDCSLAERQLDLSVVEKQLEEARESWRQHATVNRVLERIRAEYEAHRQPETLGEASRFLEKLTAGQYKRIWTPLSNDILLVDTAAGESLPVDVLSRGTREQLYLSVRLALVATFARRGVNLPIVLDDVLVNFDIERTRRAAEVLCEFAAAGHQVFLFTCHEHMWQIFKNLDADCRRLPVRKGLPEPAQVVVPKPQAALEELPESKPMKKKPRRQRVPVEPVHEEAPVEFYDYPFIERVIEERVAAAEAEPSDAEPSEFHEYSFDLTAAKYGHEAPDESEALAYIVSADADLARRGAKPQATGATYGWRDHLAPRRA